MSNTIDGHPLLPDDYYEVVEEGQHAVATYSSFLDKPKVAMWGVEETRFDIHKLVSRGMNIYMLHTFLLNITLCLPIVICNLFINTTDGFITL